jgi:peptidyl-prolyl cis-trans isomerase B (cyclophilin B)
VPTATAETANAVPAGCDAAEVPAPKDVGTIKAPTEKLSAAKKYVAKVVTTCGEFDIALDAKRAPITGGSFKYLADKGFFDDLRFHRIEPDFVIQGGDPEGTGNGGPGYSVEEAPPSDLKYDKYIVAMAKTQDEPAGTSGSQFFVVTGEQALSLTPDYALLGKVTKGKGVVDKIGSIEKNGQTGQPAGVVVIKSITVKTS